jgi:hypothetical protein
VPAYLPTETQARLEDDVAVRERALVQAWDAPVAAWDRFHELAVTERLVVHDGDRVLAAHVAAAGTLTDRGWRVSKLRQTNPIDGLAAVVLAAYFAVQPEEIGAPMFLSLA